MWKRPCYKTRLVATSTMLKATQQKHRPSPPISYLSNSGAERVLGGITVDCGSISGSHLGVYQFNSDSDLASVEGRFNTETMVSVPPDLTLKPQNSVSLYVSGTFQDAAPLLEPRVSAC